MFEIPDDLEHARVPKYLWRYAHDHSRLAGAAAELNRFLTDLAAEASIPVHSIEARAKTLGSYQDKSLKRLDDGTPKYPDPADPDRGIQDCVAARVILYTSQARDAFAQRIGRRTTAGEPFNPGDEKHNGYDSVHIIVRAIDDVDLRARHRVLAMYLDDYKALEIQLRSVAAHAWAEYEHDIRYKSPAYKALSKNDKAQVDQWFVEAGGVRRFMDDLFGRIEKLMAQEGNSASRVGPVELTGDTGDFEDEAIEDLRHLDEAELRQLIEQRFPPSDFPTSDVGDPAALSELIEHLSELGVTAVGRLESSLSAIESDQVSSLMDYPVTPTGVRRLDDELLAAFNEAYVETAPTDDRKQLLLLRLRRVRGKFAIYSIHDGHKSSTVMPAARAVRDVAALVAERYGLEASVVEGAVVRDPLELRKSDKPVKVSTSHGDLHVATNLSRSWAEEILQALIERAAGSEWSVIRAGDVLAVAPPGKVVPDDQSGDSEVSDWSAH